MPEKENTKTPEYTRKAIDKYNAKWDRLAVNLPKGTKERIKELTGKSGNAYISALVLADLERLENEKNSPAGSGPVDAALPEDEDLPEWMLVDTSDV